MDEVAHHRPVTDEINDKPFFEGDYPETKPWERRFESEGRLHPWLPENTLWINGMPLVEKLPKCLGLITVFPVTASDSANQDTYNGYKSALLVAVDKIEQSSIFVRSYCAVVLVVVEDDLQIHGLEEMWSQMAKLEQDGIPFGLQGSPGAIRIIRNTKCLPVNQTWILD